MYNIIPLILILLSFSVIIVIIVRKFPVLANLDVENIPKEKEAKFKEKIISGRLKRNIYQYSSKLKRFTTPISKTVNAFFKWAYNKLHELKDVYKNQEELPKEEVETKADELLIEAKELIREESMEEAEKILIEIINIDNKNIEAFKTLGELYYERKNFIEARETLQHVLRLEKEESGEINFDLSLVYKEMGDIDEAVNSIKKALTIEPNNPRYLDTLFEISIINKDKAEALSAYNKLKKANPENQKLDEMKAQIDEM